MRRASVAVAAVLAASAVPASVGAMTTVSYFSEAISIATDERHVGAIDTPGDVGRAINACWHPPHVGDQVTIRLGFRRDGSVIGKPFVTFRKASAGGPDADAAIATTIDEAVARCAPLPFTDQLGSEIAGQVFLIRLIASLG